MAGSKLRVEVVSNRVTSRIAATLKNLDPNSPETKGVLFRIGTMLRNMAIGNLTTLGAVDRGRLRASINFTIEASGENARLTVGAFGVKYARIVELGGPFTDQMRKAMFASFRELGMKPKEGKGIIRGGYYRARPYLAPALREARPTIVEAVQGLYKKESP